MENVKIETCSDRPVLSRCDLDAYDYQIDPYIGCTHGCHYCYALNHAETDWDREIRIHRDIAGRLESELAAVPPQRIYLGWHTDPYQPCESKHRQTRSVLEVLARKGFSPGLLTKSDLVLRDIGLLRAMDEASVSVSVAFSDDSVRRLFESNTIETEARMNALSELRHAGIRTNALLCPVIPLLTDATALIERLEGLVDRVRVYGLSILDKTGPDWKNVARILRTHFPEQESRITEIVFDRDHKYWSDLRRELQDLQKSTSMELSIHL